MAELSSKRRKDGCIFWISWPNAEAPRAAFAPCATNIKIKINPDKIRDVIDQAQGDSCARRGTGAKIDVEDDGTVSIATADSAAAEARHRIRASPEAEVGQTYVGTVSGSLISAPLSKSSRHGRLASYL